MRSTPPTTARMTRANDGDFIRTKTPRNAGIAAKMAVQCTDTGLPHDAQLATRPGPSADLRKRLIAARPQWGHLTAVMNDRRSRFLIHGIANEVAMRRELVIQAPGAVVVQPGVPIKPGPALALRLGY